jgi:sialate O-acetylesterase
MSRLSFRLVVMVAMTVAAMAPAATELPSVFGHHMVLQRNQDCPLWGWDAPDQEVTVSFADQIHRTIAGADGKWRITLDPLGTSTAPRRLTVTGSSVVVLGNVLVGEVWICAGQSNMARALSTIWDGDIVACAARNPHLRLLRVRAVGSRELRHKTNKRSIISRSEKSAQSRRVLS